MKDGQRVRGFESLLSYFDVSQRRGDKAQCRCPAHDDKHASLSITDKGNRALIYCHSGCKTSAVLEAVGLKFRDLFYDETQNEGEALRWTKSHR